MHAVGNYKKLVSLVKLAFDKMIRIIHMKLKLAILSLLCVQASLSAFADGTVKVNYNGATAEVQSTDNSIIIERNGSHVTVIDTVRREPLAVILSGSSGDGSFCLKGKNSATISLSSLQLTSKEGAAIEIKNKEIVRLVAERDTKNTLTITACNDTASHKAAALWVKGDAEFGGKGVLNVVATGKGCKGVNVQGNIIISDLNFDVLTSGMYLDVDTTNTFGPPPGMSPFGEGGFDPNNIPEEVKKMFEEMMKNGPMQMGGGMPPFGGGMPPFGGGEMPQMGGMPPFGGGMPPFGEGGGMPPMKQKYIGKAKGIRAQGTVTIESGNVTVNTSTPGAEGIEGKKGVIVNGGNVFVKACDDAINSNSTIYFNGGNTTAWSTSNDAVDANIEGGMPFFPMGQNQKKETSPGIVITGGVVNAFSQVGPPEEGLDCDFAPILVSGGTAFSIGASMGPMTSVPTEETAQQPTILFNGVNFEEGTPVILETESGKEIFKTKAPFSFKGSSTIVTSPELKKGYTYVLKSNGESYTIKIEKNFNTFNAQTPTRRF